LRRLKPPMDIAKPLADSRFVLLVDTPTNITDVTGGCMQIEKAGESYSS
jgi:hypothetical protein